MAQISIKSIFDKKEWEKFVLPYPSANFLQSWYWGEFHRSLNNAIYRIGFYRENILAGVMLSVVERAKRATYLTVPGGPLINWHDDQIVNAFVKEIQKQAIKNKCAFIRVRPQLINNEFSRDLFRTHHFIKAPMHLHADLTSQLDITKSTEQLLANMRKTTRHEIKKAVKQGVIIVTGTKDSSLAKELYEAQRRTAKRQHFIPFSYEYLSKQFDAFTQADCARIYRAEKNHTPLAYALIIFYGKEAVYHYGATTDEGRKYGGAHLIQWKAIMEAKRKGIKLYNFWGVATDNPSHRFYNLSVFKRGFGGKEVNYLPAHDLIISYPLYAINFIIETMRHLFRSL